MHEPFPEPSPEMKLEAVRTIAMRACTEAWDREMIVVALLLALSGGAYGADLRRATGLSHGQLDRVMDRLVLEGVVSAGQLS